MVVKMVEKLVACWVEKMVGWKVRRTADEKAVMMAASSVVMKVGVKADSKAVYSAVHLAGLKVDH